LNLIVPILLLAAAAWLWLDAARAREFAIVLARRYCENRGLQFLDDTVAMARMGLRWTEDGLRIRRMFRFDFSVEGIGRRTGHILMMGSKFESLDDGLPRPAERDQEKAAAPAAAAQDNKVVPFRRRDR
jgi:hypothetical protein